MKKNRRLIVLIVAAAWGRCSQASAQPVFTAENTFLFSSVTVQAVIPSGPGYRMYFSSGNFQIMSATSTNLLQWSIESGARLSVGPVFALDGASITACGILPISSGALRMFYTAVSTSGFYSVLSATSTDGLLWAKEPGARLSNANGKGFVDSPRPFPISPALTRLFFVEDSSGTANPANYHIYSATSTDLGLNWGVEGEVLPDVAFQVSVATLTDGRYRLYYSAPQGGSAIPTQILSAISAGGLVFAKESGVRLSTGPPAMITYPVVVRSTESFRWRMFLDYTPSGSTASFVSSALTLTPLPLLLIPTTVLNSQTSTLMTLTGEILSSSTAMSFTFGSNVMNWFNVTQVSDLKITGSINPFLQSRGLWNLVAADASGFSATLTNALLVDVLPGAVNITDNLFRPLQGGNATIKIAIFDSGQVTAKVFTMNGQPVSTLMDQFAPAGTYTLTWNGKTAQGHTVASGVYFLKARGPKLNTVQKIVVIK